MKAADFIMKHRFALSATVFVLTIICGILTALVPINKDRTKYLAEASNMKRGLFVLRTEFPEEEEKASIRVMFDDLTAAQMDEVFLRLTELPYVSSVSFDPDSEDYHRKNHVLFLVNSRFDYGSEEETAIEEALEHGFPEYKMVFQNNDIPSTRVPLWLLLCSVGLMIVILLVMCNSWLEPALFLITIGIAVLINMGTNIVFPFIDELTVSIGPIIQLVLSMDYSIILMNRYLQEKTRQPDRKEAMRAALAGSVSSIASSSLTTAAGLLALVFLSFKLGPELGIVLAKGVLISMICVLIILPVLILFSDRWIEKTKKRSLHIPTGFLAAFSRKARFVMPVIFLILFVVFFILQGFTRITFLEHSDEPVDEIFPKENTVVLIYQSAQEDQIAGMIEELEGDDRVRDVLAYANTLGKSRNAEEMSQVLRESGAEMQISEEMVNMLYMYYQMRHNRNEMTLLELFDFIRNELMEDPLLAGFFDEETKNNILEQQTVLDDAASSLKGPDYSRLAIISDYPEESPETLTYIDRLRQLCGSTLDEYYLVGTSVMVSEMNDTFENEYLMITLITAIAIFLVVLFAFRNLVLPLLLTLLVQSGVFITVTVIGAYSGSIYYLALLIVQSILMGATIDYGIVFCSFYRENRKSRDMTASLTAAYERSIHTIMTSGSILVLVLAALGFYAPSAMISTVSITLSIGALVAILLVLFVLPGLTACCDRLIIFSLVEKIRKCYSSKLEKGRK